MSPARVPIVEQVLAAVPAALAYVGADGSVPYENARMAGLPSDLREGALRGCASAREGGATYVEIVQSTAAEEKRIWRFDYCPASRADDKALVVIGTDVTDSRRMEGQLEELLAYEQSARAMTELERVRLAEQNVQLEQVASTDALTGLVNRRAFADALEDQLAHARDTGLAVALLYVDLDRFKAINDTLGHAAGDDLLVHVAQRLRGCIRDDDLAGRLGGDEFAVMLGQLPPEAADEVAARVAERALALLSEPVLLEGSEQTVGASIGIAIARSGDVDSESLVAHADSAMYEAKRAGRGTAVASRVVLNGAA